jgi:antirestriction protein
MHVTGMTDNAGKNLRGTGDEAGWQKCGASEPCFADTLLEDRFIMRPILAPDSSVPYVQFEAGAQNWRSDQVGELGKGAVPACTMVPCLSCEGP